MDAQPSNDKEIISGSEMKQTSAVLILLVLVLVMVPFTQLIHSEARLYSIWIVRFLVFGHLTLNLLKFKGSKWRWLWEAKVWTFGLDIFTTHLLASCFADWVLCWFGLVSLCTSKHSTQNPVAPDVLIGHWRLETGDRTPTVLSLTELKLNCAEIVIKISDCKCLQGDWLHWKHGVPKSEILCQEILCQEKMESINLSPPPGTGTGTCTCNMLDMIWLWLWYDTPDRVQNSSSSQQHALGGKLKSTRWTRLVWQTFFWHVHVLVLYEMTIKTFVAWLTQS